MQAIHIIAILAIAGLIIQSVADTTAERNLVDAQRNLERAKAEADRLAHNAKSWEKQLAADAVSRAETLKSAAETMRPAERRRK
jgi:Tfp pilus assembly major pilin PilA